MTKTGDYTRCPSHYPLPKLHSIGLSSPEGRWRLFKAATCRPPKRAHEIVQFLERKRFFQNRRCSDKRELLFGILLPQVINKFGPPGARTAEEFQSDDNKVMGSVVAVNAERFIAV